MESVGRIVGLGTSSGCKNQQALAADSHYQPGHGSVELAGYGPLHKGHDFWSDLPGGHHGYTAWPSALSQPPK